MYLTPKHKNTRGPWSTLLIWETFPSNKQARVKVMIIQAGWLKVGFFLKNIRHFIIKWTELQANINKTYLMMLLNPFLWAKISDPMTIPRVVLPYPTWQVNSMATLEPCVLSKALGHSCSKYPEHQQYIQMLLCWWKTLWPLQEEGQSSVQQNWTLT